MSKSFIGAAVLMAGLGLATPSNAETILFDTNGAVGGAAGTMTADIFDWLPGNSLLIENSAGTKATLLYQANLGSITSPDSLAYGNGTNGFFYTAVAGFGVDVNTSGADATFTFDATNPTNFFKIYVTTTPTTPLGASDLLGTCFVCGTEILSGTAIADGFTSTNHVTSTAGGPLDQFGLNNYLGINSVLGNGSTALNVLVKTFDSNYFLNLVEDTTLAFVNTSQIAPYHQANPSAAFSSNGVLSGDVVGTPGVGAVNGLCVDALGAPLAVCKIVAQSDANTSFTGIQAVPEPATMTMLGIGLLGAAARRRQQKKNAK